MLQGVPSGSGCPFRFWGSIPVPGVLFQFRGLPPLPVLGVPSGCGGPFWFRGAYSGSRCSPFRFWGSLLVPGVFEWLPLAQCINGKVLVRDPPPPQIR